MLRRIENREALDTAHRARSNCGQVFRYAIAVDESKKFLAACLQLAASSDPRSRKNSRPQKEENPQNIRGFLVRSGRFELP